ncbi:MAG: hypothetical protein CR986_02280 [Ignavibacteriae bacterium]|nr:MAG: hypothetical protein CR986_02280 [Ignavibacteriota bacterium]
MTIFVFNNEIIKKHNLFYLTIKKILRLSIVINFINKSEENPMKKKHILYIILIIATSFLTNCDLKEEAPTSGSGDSTAAHNITLQGSVIDAVTGDGIADATVKIMDGSVVRGAVTDNSGKYSYTFATNADKDILIIAIKDGYRPDTLSVFAIKDKITNVSVIQLRANKNGTGGGTGVSLSAASINLHSQSAQSLGVKESGALESLDIIFEVRDSAGVTISEDNAVDLSFSFGATPGGGEYLFPASVRTNALGKATVTLNTGRIAGVVQVIAQTEVNGKTIKSKPILVSIHGGFPVEDVFYVAAEKLNYPYYGIIGKSIKFTAYAGDKYNNPVRPGTSIYFTTSSGIIGGSAPTNEAGAATVELLTEPHPEDVIYGKGFFRVTAKTADENKNTISTETIRLLSGKALLNVSPSSFTLANGGSQTFTYTLMDVNGNPLSEGQTVKVSIESKNVVLSGDIDIEMPDTQSKTWTRFSFTAYDALPDSIAVENVKIKVATTGKNSDKKVMIFGSAE